MKHIARIHLTGTESFYEDDQRYISEPPRYVIDVDFVAVGSPEILRGTLTVDTSSQFARDLFELARWNYPLILSIETPK